MSSTTAVPTLRSLRAQRHMYRRHTHHPSPTFPVEVVKEKEEEEEEEYANPLYESPRWVLAARVAAIRSGAYLGYSIFHYSDPNAPPASKTIWLDSTLSRWKGKNMIAVHVFDPARSRERNANRSEKKRLAVINFHGGGFFLGTGTDDRHWVGALNSSLDAVVFSVNYRLAPSYPYPIPVEDCADAILQISARADEFRFDKIVLSGFSAGGTLALASWALLQDPGRWNYRFDKPIPDICGMALFYPGLDWSIPRHKKREASPQSDLFLSESLTDLIDACYIFPRVTGKERKDPRLSPGLMPDEMLERLPPIHICMCEHDMLRPEEERFARRLQDRGKEVTVRLVKNEKHAWDKPPPMTQKPSAPVEYTAAIAFIKGWIDHEGGVRGLDENVDDEGNLAEPS